MSTEAVRSWRTTRQNIGTIDRCISVGVGAALFLVGLPRRSTAGIIAPLAGAALVYRGLTGHCPVCESLGLDLRDHSDHVGVRAQRGCRLHKTIHVRKPPNELYAYWRDLQNLPHLMDHLESVTEIDEAVSHWVARGPFGKAVEWYAEMHNVEPGRLIAWRSLPESQVATAGSVKFEPDSARGGTEVTLTMKYDPPGGKLTAAVADFFGQGLEQQISHDLVRFKQAIEAAPRNAEVSTSEPSDIDGSAPFQY